MATSFSLAQSGQGGSVTCPGSLQSPSTRSDAAQRAQEGLHGLASPPARLELAPDSLRVAKVLLPKVSFRASPAFVFVTPQSEDDSARVLLGGRLQKQKYHNSSREGRELLWKSSHRVPVLHHATHPRAGRDFVPQEAVIPLPILPPRSRQHPAGSPGELAGNAGQRGLQEASSGPTSELSSPDPPSLQKRKLSPSRRPSKQPPSQSTVSITWRYRQRERQAAFQACGEGKALDRAINSRTFQKKPPAPLPSAFNFLPPNTGILAGEQEASLGCFRDRYQSCRFVILDAFRWT